MKFFHKIVSSILICSIPTPSFGQEDFQSIPIQQTPEDIETSTYDELLNLVDDIENSDDEENYNEADLDGISNVLVDLAQKGFLPDDEEDASELAFDTHELLYSDSSLQYAYCLHHDKLG